MPQVTIQQALELGVKHQQEGRLREAEGIFRQVLSSQPNHPDALHLLGLVAYQSGQADAAIALVRQAISLNPNASAFHCNLGRMLAESKQFDDAIRAYHEAVRLRPDSFEAFHNLSVALLNHNQIDQAITAGHEALRLRPNSPETINALGQALHKHGRVGEAIQLFQQAITMAPQFGGAYTNLGIALQAQGNIPAAMEAFTEARRLDPKNPSVWINYGKVMQSINDQDAAIEAFESSLCLDPKYSEGYYNLGNALHLKLQYDQAINAFHQALSLNPQNAGVWNNLALSLHAKGDYKPEIEAYQKALSLQPDSPLVRYNLGVTQLLLGDFENGWAGYEYRIQTKELETKWQEFPQPRWTGENLDGKQILIHAEQAFGDTIQFVRYLPLIKQRGGRIIMQCQPELFELLKNIDAAEQIIKAGEPLPDFDVHCPLLSLPQIFKTQLHTIPWDGPYVVTNSQANNRWKEKLGAEDRRKIGLVWAGRPQHKNDHNRSMPAAMFASLNQISNARFFSLQKGDAAKQLDELSKQMEMTDWTADLNDFADTAALIHSLDLVITVDTAIAHLAGAMGKPVWLLLPFVPDWRWMLDRTDSPWYPTMRLFRQNRLGDWSEPVNGITEALASSLG